MLEHGNSTVAEPPNKYFSGARKIFSSFGRSNRGYSAPTTSSCQCTTMHKSNASILFVVFVLIALIALNHTATSGAVVTGYVASCTHRFALPQRVAATICVDFVALVVLVEKVIARPPWHSSWPTARLSPWPPWICTSTAFASPPCVDTYRSELDDDHVRVRGLHHPRISTSTSISTFVSGAANFTSPHLLPLPNESVILFEGPTTKITFTRHNMIAECVLSFERLITKCAPARPSYNSTAPQHHHAVHDLTDIERASQSACLSHAAIVACFRLAHGPPPHIPTNCPVTGAHNFPTFLPKILIAKFALPQEDLINTSAPARHPLPVFDNQNMLIMPATLCFFAVRFKTEDRVFVLIPDLASKTFLLNVSAVFVRVAIEHLLNMFAVSVRASIERSPTFAQHGRRLRARVH